MALHKTKKQNTSLTIHTLCQNKMIRQYFYNNKNIVALS
jgi:hypothetical protein